MARTARCSPSDGWLVYRWIDVNVYWKSTDRRPAMMQRRGFSGISNPDRAVEKASNDRSARVAYSRSYRD